MPKAQIIRLSPNFCASTISPDRPIRLRTKPPRHEEIACDKKEHPQIGQADWRRLLGSKHRRPRSDFERTRTKPLRHKERDVLLYKYLLLAKSDAREELRCHSNLSGSPFHKLTAFSLGLCALVRDNDELIALERAILRRICGPWRRGRQICRAEPAFQAVTR